MKKAFFLLFSIFFFASCGKEMTLTIVDKDGYSHQAIVAPVMKDQLPALGSVIPIMKPHGFPVTEDKFIFNDYHWKLSDTSDLAGIIRREIIFGEVVSIQ